MKIMDLLEENIPDGTEYYLEEGCGIFAVALASLIGGTIGVISNDDGDAWDDEIPFEVTHAFVTNNNGETFDVLGKRSINDMADDFRLVGWSIPVDDIPPKVFFVEYMGDSDDKPLYGTRSDVLSVMQYIKNSPKWKSVINNTDDRKK